jgi:Tol biopolymer transport system component
MRASLFAFLALLAAVLASAGDARTPSRSGLIVFSSNRGPNVGNLELYRVRLDGSGRRDLTRSQGLDAAPAASPDGRLIAFVAFRFNGGRETRRLWVMGRDGGGKRPLTPASMLVDPSSRPTWSPGGGRIAFAADEANRRGIYVVGVEGGQVDLVSPNAIQPAWEPYGDRIAFTKLEVRPPGVVERVGLVNSDGSDERLLTDGGFDGLAIWAPSGGALAFCRRQGLGNSLYTVDLDTGEESEIVPEFAESIQTITWSTPRRIVFAGSHVWRVEASGRGVRRLAVGAKPAISPHRKLIAFLRGRELRVMNADGSNARLLRRLSREFVEGELAWVGGGRLVYASGQEATDYDLWTARASGGQARRLMDGPLDEREPQWSPDHRMVAFVRAHPRPPSAETIWVSDAYGRHAHRIGPGRHPGWSPDGDALTFSRSGSVWTLPLEGDHARRVVEHGARPAWSPLGRTIAYVNGGEARTVDLRSGQRHTVFDMNVPLECQDIGATLQPPEWAPDGEELLVVGECDRGRSSRIAAVVVSADGRRWRLLPDLGETMSRVGWSPDGRRIVVRTNDRGSSIVSMRLDGSLPRTVAWSSADDRDPDW